MRRPKLDTRDQRELYEVQHDPTVHLSVQPNQINRLKGKTPLTLEGWNELKAILNRTIAFCQLFVPGLPLADAARTVLTYLTRHVNLHDIDRVPGWSDAKTKEIIYAFTWFEKDHVGGIPATDTMADTSFQIHRKVPNMQTLMSVVTSQQPHFHPAQLPSGLRPTTLPPPPLQPQPAGTWPSGTRSGSTTTGPTSRPTRHGAPQSGPQRCLQALLGSSARGSTPQCRDLPSPRQRWHDHRHRPGLPEPTGHRLRPVPPQRPLHPQGLHP